MGLLLAALVVLFGFPIFVACTLSGLLILLSAFRSTSFDRGRTASRGFMKLIAALFLAGVPWVATSIAESSTGWVDTDHDGMLDGLVNGSYDWVDFNGGAWATAAAVLVIVIAGCLALTLAVTRQAHGAAHPEAVPVGD